MKRRILAAATAVFALALASGADARPQHGSGGGFGRGHGGWHGPGGGRPGGWHGPRTRGFFGGGVFFSPLFYDPFFYPYYVPYPYPVYSYPPPDYTWSAPPPETGGAEPEEERRAERSPSTRDDVARATYGLVQLRGIPDGASVDLDGRFWLTAQDLDERWLALPRGEHTVSVRVRGSEIVERRIDVKEGKNHVIRFGPFRHETG
jgi:hypothetical protein